jgi:type IV secretory pathway VirJ component
MDARREYQAEEAAVGVSGWHRPARREQEAMSDLLERAAAAEEEAHMLNESCKKLRTENERLRVALASLDQGHVDYLGETIRGKVENAALAMEDCAAEMRRSLDRNTAPSRVLVEAMSSIRRGTHNAMMELESAASAAADIVAVMALDAAPTDGGDEPQGGGGR